MGKYSYYFASLVKMLTGMRPLSTLVGVFFGNTKQGDQTIHLPRQSVSFIVRGAMDIWSVKETFLDGFYERYGAQIGDGWTIIDIGGGIGDFTTLAARRHPQNRVFAFEPTPQSYELLKKNLVINHIQNASAFQEAIWSSKGTIYMNITTGEPGQYISQSQQPGSTGAAIAVPSIPLEDVLVRFDLNQCDLLKMDCEGAEYGILFNTPDDIIAKIKRIILEYHDNITEYTHADLERFLISKGFTVQSHPNYVHGYLGYLYAYQP